MDVKTLHPQITAERQAEWQLMRDSVSGESDVKKRAEVYLPRPSGYSTSVDPLGAMYLAYKTRAQFPEILAPSVAALVGIAHGKEIKIELPSGMDYLWENADSNGLPLEAFHRRITRSLLVLGRYGVLADAPETGGDPFLVGYAGDAVINWDKDFWVLDECGMVRNGFEWVREEKYRVLKMDGAAYAQTVYTDDTESDVLVSKRGGGALPRVPFVVANARDISATVETAPLIGVSRAALAIYQLSADYRHQLYMSGQETLVAINGPKPTAVGAGVVHEMQGDGQLTPDLKYVSPSCSGIEAHKAAIEDNRIAAVQAGARLLEQSENVQESGSARQLRFASETATLTSVVQASCGLLERALRNVAMMVGLPEDQVVVTPPVDLLDRSMTPSDAEGLMRIWQAGGFSYQTYYENIQRGGIASAERDYEEELSLIDDEQIPQDVAVQ